MSLISNYITILERKKEIIEDCEKAKEIVKNLNSIEMKAIMIFKDLNDIRIINKTLVELNKMNEEFIKNNKELNDIEKRVENNKKIIESITKANKITVNLDNYDIAKIKSGECNCVKSIENDIKETEMKCEAQPFRPKRRIERKKKEEVNKDENVEKNENISSMDDLLKVLYRLGGVEQKDENNKEQKEEPKKELKETKETNASNDDDFSFYFVPIICDDDEQ